MKTHGYQGRLGRTKNVLKCLYGRDNAVALLYTASVIKVSIACYTIAIVSGELTAY